MLPTRQPRSRVSQVRIKESRGSCSIIHISIVRNTVSATSIKASIAGLGLLLLGTANALADPDCPQPAPLTGAPPPVTPRTNPVDQPITIESDDKDFQYEVNGNARLCGNVVMKQGDRNIRADCLEYDATNQSAKLEGGIVYTD